MGYERSRAIAYSLCGDFFSTMNSMSSKRTKRDQTPQFSSSNTQRASDASSNTTRAESVVDDRTKQRQEKTRQDSDYWLSTAIELDEYVPAYFTFIATKLARGAAAVYRRHFGVGIEVWRVLVMLARDEKVSVNMVCRLIGMDKGAVSRAFKTMYEMELIRFSHDPNDGRIRYATLTAKGRQKHDEIKEIAMERQRVLLSVLQPEEKHILQDLLLRLHAGLPDVEEATQEYLLEHGYKKSSKKKRES